MLCVVGFFMMVHLATNKAFMINNKLSTCIRFHSKLAAPATSLFRCEEVLPSISVSGEQNITSTLKEIKFTVFGEPLALARHRMTKRGFNYNPSSKFQEMFLNACLPHLPSTPLDGPLDMKMIFHLKRPKTHYRSGKYSHILKEGAELYHSKKSGKFLLRFLTRIVSSIFHN